MAILLFAPAPLEIASGIIPAIKAKEVIIIGLKLNFAPIMPSELIWEMAQLFYNIEVNSASTDNVKTAFQKIAESLSDMYSNDPANQLPAISLAMKRSLLFVINHHLQLSTNPSLSLAFIQKSLKLTNQN